MFLQVYGKMPLVVPGSLQERNRTVQVERRGGNQGGRQGENQGGRQHNGNGGDQGGMPGGDDRGRHNDGQSGAPSDSQQYGNEGSQGAQHSRQSGSGGGERAGRHRTGRGQGSGGYHSGSREENGGRNSGEQNLPAGGRGRQNQDQRRYFKKNCCEHDLEKLNPKTISFHKCKTKCGRFSFVLAKKNLHLKVHSSLKEVLLIVTLVQGCDVRLKGLTFSNSDNLKFLSLLRFNQFLHLLVVGESCL